MGISAKVAVVGVYESPTRDAPGVHPFELHAEAVHGALKDAGLSLADVDGLATAVGDFAEGGNTENLIEVAEYLGVRPTYLDSTDVGGCSFIVQAGNAAAAIVTGLANVVVISYAACPRWWPIPYPPIDAPIHPAGPGQYELPYAVPLVANYALLAQRYLYEYGATPEQLASVAVTARAHAAQNKHARYTDPISVDDVLGSPMIASPLHRLDCCVLTDGAGAIVLTSAERANDLARPPAYVLGYGAAASRLSMSQLDGLTTPAAISGPRAFRMAGLGPADIDVAQLYDAFTITPLLALEDLGFCGRGEAGPFAADGNLGISGALPFNTDGGGLSSNHPGKRGIFLLVEAVRQLRDTGPGAQVPGASTALVHGIGGYLSATATMILSR